MYYKNKMVEEYGRDYEKYPEIFYREVPPKVNDNYMARAGEIRDGAAQALEYYISDPNFFYLLANKDMLTEKEAKQINIECIQHLERDLQKSADDNPGHTWAGKMKATLSLWIKKRKDLCRRILCHLI